MAIIESLKTPKIYALVKTIKNVSVLFNIIVQPYVNTSTLRFSCGLVIFIHFAIFVENDSISIHPFII